MDGGDLVETTGRRITRRPLSTLREVRFGTAAGGRRAALLRFARGRTLLVSHGWAGPGRFEDRTAGYAAFLRALATASAEVAPTARFTTGSLGPREAVIWMVAVLGVGVGALMLFSLTAGAAGLGAALAARMLFVLILVFAVTPWLSPPAPKLDPRALPTGLLD